MNLLKYMRFKVLSFRHSSLFGTYDTFNTDFQSLHVAKNKKKTKQLFVFYYCNIVVMINELHMESSVLSADDDELADCVVQLFEVENPALCAALWRGDE